MDDRKAKIIDMITKLSAVNNPDSGAFMNEMNVAAAKIQELMDKYSITQDEIDNAVVDKKAKEMDDEFNSKVSDYEIRGIREWHWRLAKIIARITHTKNFSRSNRGRGYMVFFGIDTNVTVANDLFTNWVQVIESMAEKATDDYWKIVMKRYDYSGFLKRKKEGKEFGKFMDTVPYDEQTTYFKRSWLYGCISAIESAVRESEKNRSSETTSALAVYDEKLISAYAELSKSFRTIKTRSVGHLSELGYDQGSAVGSKIKLDSKRIED